jgi:hypothetical protein
MHLGFITIIEYSNWSSLIGNFKDIKPTFNDMMRTKVGTQLFIIVVNGGLSTVVLISSIPYFWFIYTWYLYMCVHYVFLMFVICSFYILLYRISWRHTVKRQPLNGDMTTQWRSISMNTSCRKCQVTYIHINVLTHTHTYTYTHK